MPFTVNREKLAYAAGLYDGKGHSRYNVLKRDGQKNIRLQVKMTDPEPLRRFWEAINYRAKVYGPYKQGWGISKNKCKDAYLILIQNFEDFQFAMCCLWPWLSTPKKEQFKETTKNYLDHRRVVV